MSFEDITAAGPGVTLVLVAGAGTASGQSTTTVSGIENLTGSANADRLTGDSADNTLSGLGGDDVLDGAAGNDTILGDRDDDRLLGGVGDDALDGQSGNDTLLPGAGVGSNVGGSTGETTGDTVSFEDLPSPGVGVTLTLVAGAGTAWDQSTTVVSEIESIMGTDNGDRLTGDGGANGSFVVGAMTSSPGKQAATRWTAVRATTSSDQALAPA